MLKEESVVLNSSNSTADNTHSLNASIKALSNCCFTLKAKKSFGVGDEDVDKDSERKRLKTNKHSFVPLFNNNVYVLNIDVNRSRNDQFLVHLSNNALNICDFETLTSIRKIPKWDLNNSCNAFARYYLGKNDSIFNGSFNSNLILVPTNNSIDLMDLRESKMYKAAISFKAQTVNENLNIISFDYSADSNLLVAGSEVAVDQNAYLMLWDMRNNDAWQTWSESHTDDITAVEFHPSKKDFLLSGSDDCLINLYDLTQEGEEEALLLTMNAEDSIAKIRWLLDGNKFTCIMQNESIQFWDEDSVKPSLVVDRDHSIIQSIDLKDCRTYDSAIDMWCEGNEVYFAVATNDGLSTVYRYDDNKSKEPFEVHTVLENGHHSLLRSITSVKDKLVTGGEDAIVCLWQHVKTDADKES
ncbi:WD repeat-containing protein 89-like protein [Dinothrombium tinctorium]|uniref:WD repeat-containing protein 89 n=1 Tax=Dinothrombium tinctorium TaxID=1965070 RepID=A0A3S3PKC5_9ACAR|nr:WD repeat-containing protein 89-like protein [Dinothrombium tinctorium]RWS11477.1 WD repeat-containing protein 89-like protein [Dinothrombium tinctorium]RWS11481.1 WD repeat-containing protein 89-like protein [Dinothrombium tinctorium]RWS14996.1 WD repeat-containing protein 89-like protein [Dinothrombium tinctorium]